MPHYSQYKFQNLGVRQYLNKQKLALLIVSTGPKHLHINLFNSLWHSHFLYEETEAQRSYFT